MHGREGTERLKVRLLLILKASDVLFQPTHADGTVETMFSGFSRRLSETVGAELQQ